MPIRFLSTAKPYGEYPIAESQDIQHGDKRLNVALSDIETVNASKADKTYVDSELAKKADNSTVSTLAATVSGKADSSTVSALDARVSTNETNIATQTSRIDKLSNYVTLEMFGAVGDGSTDDKTAIQNALNWSKENHRAVYLNDKRYYTSGTLYAGGAIIRSVSGIPGSADPFYLKKPDGTFVFNNANWDYFFNSSQTGRDYTWSKMIEDTSYGAAIVSDFNGAILYAEDNTRFDIDGIGIIGNHRKKNQDGIQTAVPTAYHGCGQKINNTNVIGCGRHGINLERGFEVSVCNNVKSMYNNGYGLRTGIVSSIDCSTEYLRFYDCYFAYNRLSGIFFSQWRKCIEFYGCDFSGNGQYDGVDGVDPLLGYDRTVKATAEEMPAGVWINDTAIDITRGTPSHVFKMESCTGEAVAVGLHMRCKYDFGKVRDVVLQNNYFMAASRIVSSVSAGNENGYSFYFDVDYIADWNISNNGTNFLDSLKFKNTPSVSIGSIILTDANGKHDSSYDYLFKTYSYGDMETKRNVIAGNRVYGNQIVIGDILCGREDRDIEIDLASLDYNKYIDEHKSAYSAMYLLTSNSQSVTFDYCGGYLLIILRTPSGKFVMMTLALSDTYGFDSVPEISDDGKVTIHGKAWYVYQFERIDNLKTTYE